MFTITFNNKNQSFSTIEEVVKFLNEALYYSKEVYISNPLTHDLIEYSKTDEEELIELFEDVNAYDLDFLRVMQIFE